MLTAIRTSQEPEAEPDIPTTIQPIAPRAFSPTLARAVENANRRARREQELRARHAELRRAILRSEHKLELMRREIAQIDAELLRNA